MKITRHGHYAMSDDQVMSSAVYERKLRGFLIRLGVPPKVARTVDYDPERRHPPTHTLADAKRMADALVRTAVLDLCSGITVVEKGGKP